MLLANFVVAFSAAGKKPSQAIPRQLPKPGRRKSPRRRELARFDPALLQPGRKISGEGPRVYEVKVRIYAAAIRNKGQRAWGAQWPPTGLKLVLIIFTDVGRFFRRTAKFNGAVGLLRDYPAKFLARGNKGQH